MDCLESTKKSESSQPESPATKIYENLFRSEDDWREAMAKAFAGEATPEEMGAVKQYGFLYVALEGSLPGGAGKVGRILENEHSEQSFLRMLDSYLDKQELMRFYRAEKALKGVVDKTFLVDDVVGDAKNIFHWICMNDERFCVDSMLVVVEDIPVIFGAPGVGAQTVFGYKQLPVVVIPPDKPNTYTTLTVVHELTHAIHLHFSSQNNSIDDFLPDRLVAETLANAFQRAALETEAILKYYGDFQVGLLKALHAKKSLGTMETALRKQSYMMSVGAGPYNRGANTYGTVLRGGNLDTEIAMAWLCGGKDEFACFKEALVELESVIEINDE